MMNELDKPNELYSIAGPAVASSRIVCYLGRLLVAWMQTDKQTINVVIN